MAQQAVTEKRACIRVACEAFRISETCYRYQPKTSSDNALIADWLLRLTTTHRTWGFGLCFLYLRNVKGLPYNHKRVYRIYRELELNLRIKPKRRFNRTVRHEWLDLHLFDSIRHAQDTATRWLWSYNNERPNMTLGGLTPRQAIQEAA
jgi:hypothetical protein